MSLLLLLRALLAGSVVITTMADHPGTTPDPGMTPTPSPEEFDASAFAIAMAGEEPLIPRMYDKRYGDESSASNEAAMSSFVSVGGRPQQQRMYAQRYGDDSSSIMDSASVSETAEIMESSTASVALEEGQESRQQHTFVNSQKNDVPLVKELTVDAETTVSPESMGGRVARQEHTYSSNIQRRREDDATTVADPVVIVDPVEPAAASPVESVDRQSPRRGRAFSRTFNQRDQTPDSASDVPAVGRVPRQQRTFSRTYAARGGEGPVSAEAVAAAALAAAAAEVGMRVRPRQRAYARPYIQRVWLLPRTENATAYRLTHAQNIRTFAHAINDTNTFLRFLKEEERRLGLRIGTDEESLRDAAASLAAGTSAVAAAQAAKAGGAGAASGVAASNSVESDYDDNSISGYRERTVSPTTSAPTTIRLVTPRDVARQARANWFLPTALPAVSKSATVLPFYAYASTAASIAGSVSASTPAVSVARPRKPTYRGLVPEPTNRTTPYTVTPVVSYHDPNASLTYASRANNFASLSASINVLPASLDEDSNPRPEVFYVSGTKLQNAISASSSGDASEGVGGDAVVSSSGGGGSYFSISSEEPETEERAAPSAFVQYPVEYRDVRHRPESGHAGRYVVATRDDEKGDLAVGTREFHNRPMVPMSDAASYNLQTAPRGAVNDSLKDHMVMSPSTVAPRVVEVYSMSPNAYYYVSTTVQPPVFENGTLVPSGFESSSFSQVEEAPSEFVGYQQTSNKLRTNGKNSARYQDPRGASNPLLNYNPYSIYPKYRATYVPKKQHSVKVVSSSTPEPPPPPPPSPTLLSYIEEPYSVLEERRSLAASRGASGNLSPASPDPSPSPSPSADATSLTPMVVEGATAAATTATAYATMPYSFNGGSNGVVGFPRGRSAAAHVAASAARMRRPKSRRRHRKGHGGTGGGHRRRSGRMRFGVARSLLPPPASRRQAHAAIVPETWQWQEGFMHPTERPADSTAASVYAHRRVRPTHSPSFSPATSPDYSPNYSLDYSPNYSPAYSSTSSPSSFPTNSPIYSSTYSPTYSPSHSPTYSPTFAPTFAVSSTASPSPLELVMTQASAGREVAVGASRRAGRAPSQRQKHREAVPRRPNVVPDEESDEEAEHERRRQRLFLGHDGVGENGSIPGVPGRDYPTYSKPPVRNFSCLDFKGRRGYVADPTTRCQVFYICPGDGRGKAMLCPNGTVFNQEVSVCDWWFNVKCGEN